MARLIEIDRNARHPAEREAQLHLRDELPQSWYITTNMKEHHFKHLKWSRTHTEIDSILICPFGIFVIDFKNDAGQITPNVKSGWISANSGTARERSGANPFEKAGDKLFALKKLLVDHDPKLERLWLNYLIVLTRGTVNWSGSDVREKNPLRWQVAELDTIKDRVRQVSPKPDKKLTSATVRQVVEALKGPKLPADLLVSFDLWGQDEYYVVGQVLPGIVVAIDGEAATVEIENQITARLDASDISWRQVDYPTDLLRIGEKRDFKITAINPTTQEISLGVKQLQDDPLLKLTVGSVMRGQIIGLTGDAATVDLGDLVGRLAAADVTWRQTTRPIDLLRQHQSIKAKIIAIDRQTRTISLGIKQLEDDPLTKLAVGGRLRGVVTAKSDDGRCAIIDLGRVFGRLDGAEISWTSRGSRPTDALTVEQEIEVQILAIDPATRSVAVSRKCLLPNPWKQFDRMNRPGGSVHGVIKEKSAAGLLVALDEGLEGFVSLSNLGWYRPASAVLRDCRTGEEIRARVLAVDAQEQRISLGMLSTLSAERRRLQVLLRAHLCDLVSQPKLRMAAAQAYSDRGNAHAGNRQFDRAIEDLNEAIRLDPTASLAYNRRGNAYYSKGDYTGAIESYDEAIRLNAGSAVQYANRAGAYHRKGEHARAVEDYDRALRIDQNYRPAWTNRGDANLKRGHYLEAIKDYDRSIALNGGDGAVFNDRGVCHFRNGDFDSAIADFDEAIRLGPASEVRHTNRGDCYRAKKLYATAINDYEEALRINPKYTPAIEANSAALREMASAAAPLPSDGADQAPPRNDGPVTVPAKTLTLRPRSELGTVKQSFSHGRSKQVVVESIGRRRVGSSALVKDGPARLAGIVLRPLSEEERILRVKASAEATQAPDKD